MPLVGDLTVAFGMAIHELTTNGVNYGAHSLVGGRVSVTWSLDDDSALTWRWLESDGPPVVPPTGKRFGTRLLQRVLADQLQAKVEQRFDPTGLRVHAVVPRSLTRALDDIGLPIELAADTPHHASSP